MRVNNKIIFDCTFCGREETSDAALVRALGVAFYHFFFSFFYFNTCTGRRRRRAPVTINTGFSLATLFPLLRFEVSLMAESGILSVEFERSAQISLLFISASWIRREFSRSLNRKAPVSSRLFDGIVLGGDLFSPVI